MPKTFRNGVIAVVTRPDGKILVGNRYGIKNAWQLPQGGIDQGEEPKQAVMRELLEEIGSNQFEVINHLKEPIRYTFPKSITSKISKKYCGQSMYWFILKTEEPESLDLKKATDKEFDKLSWFTPNEILTQVISWRLDFYKQGFKELGIPYDSTY